MIKIRLIFLSLRQMQRFISLNTHFLLFFGDLLTSSSMLTLGNIHASMTLRSFTRIGVHEALVFSIINQPLMPRKDDVISLFYLI